MKSTPAVPPASPADAGETPVDSERDQISQNIEAVLEFYAREEQKIGGSRGTRTCLVSRHLAAALTFAAPIAA